MPVWQLDPIDQNDGNWKTSIHCGRVIVRASDERRARELANIAFPIAVEHGLPGGDAIDVPWGQENLVTCHRLGGSEYEEDGPDTIFEPDWAVHELEPHK